MGTFDSPHQPVASLNIPAFGLIQPVEPPVSSSQACARVPSTKEPSHELSMEVSAAGTDQSQVRAASSPTPAAALARVSSSHPCRSSYNAGLIGCRSSPAELTMQRLTESGKAGPFSGPPSQELHKQSAAARRPAQRSAALTPLQIPCQDRGQPCQLSLREVHSPQLQSPRSAISPHLPTGKAEQSAVLSSPESMQPEVHPSAAFKGQPKPSEAWVQTACRLRMSPDLPDQERDRATRGVPSLELPVASPATPVFCESPWVDSAGGLAMHGPAPHSSFWRRSAGHTSPPSLGASTPCPGSSSLNLETMPRDAGTRASDTATSRPPSEQPGSLRAPLKESQVANTCESPSLLALPPCLTSKTPVVEPRKQRPGRLAERGGQHEAHLGSGNGPAAGGQHWQPLAHAFPR